MSLDYLQHVRGDLIHILQGPDAERHHRSVILKREDTKKMHPWLVLKYIFSGEAKTSLKILFREIGIGLYFKETVSYERLNTESVKILRQSGLTWKERRLPDTLTYVPGGRTELSTAGSCTHHNIEVKRLKLYSFELGWCVSRLMPSRKTELLQIKDKQEGIRYSCELQITLRILLQIMKRDNFTWLRNRRL